MISNIWLGNLIAYCLQITLVVAGAALLSSLIGLRPPTARLAFFRAILLICLCLPLLQTWRPAEVRLRAQSVVDRAITLNLNGANAALSEQPASPPRRAINYALYARIVLVVLACTVLARAMWLALGFFSLSRYRRTSTRLEPLPDGVIAAQRRLTVKADFRVSQSISGPVTFGLRRPVILLPASFLAMGGPVQEAIISHELLHVKRRDWVSSIIEELILALLCFHPAIWWLVGHVRLTREQVIDHEAIRLTNGRAQYLEALLETARIHNGAGLIPAARFLRRRHLSKRVASIVKESTMSKRRLIASMVIGFGAILLVARASMALFPLQSQATLRVQAKIQEQPFQAVRIDYGGDNLIQRPGIEYPGHLVENRVEGAVTLQITIAGDGTVSDAYVVSGPDQLRKIALQSVLEWQYDTAKRPAGIAEVTISFHLPPTGELSEDARFLEPIGQNLVIEGELKDQVNDMVNGTVNGIIQGQLQSLHKEHSSGTARLTLRSGDEVTLKQQVEGLGQNLDDEAIDSNGTVLPNVHSIVFNRLRRLRSVVGLGTGQVTRIMLDGVPDAIRLQISDSQPVHLGDQLTEESLLNLQTKLKAIDEHLVVHTVPVEGGSVWLVITRENPSDEGAAGQFTFHNRGYAFHRAPGTSN